MQLRRRLGPSRWHVRHRQNPLRRPPTPQLALSRPRRPWPRPRSKIPQRLPPRSLRRLSSSHNSGSRASLSSLHAVRAGDGGVELPWMGRRLARRWRRRWGGGRRSAAVTGMVNGRSQLEDPPRVPVVQGVGGGPSRWSSACSSRRKGVDRVPDLCQEEGRRKPWTPLRQQWHTQGSWIVQPRQWLTASWTYSSSSAGLRLHLRARGQSAASSAPHPRRWPAARWPRCLGVRRSGRCLLSWSSFVSAAPKSTVAGLVAVIFLSAATSLTPYEILLTGRTLRSCHGLELESSLGCDGLEVNSDPENINSGIKPTAIFVDCLLQQIQ